MRQASRLALYANVILLVVEKKRTKTLTVCLDCGNIMTVSGVPTFSSNPWQAFGDERASGNVVFWGFSFFVLMKLASYAC